MICFRSLFLHLDVQEIKTLFLPLFSALPHTHSAAMPGRRIVTGSLADFKPNLTACAALAPGRPGCPTSIPAEKGKKEKTVSISEPWQEVMGTSPFSHLGYRNTFFFPAALLHLIRLM